MGVGAGGCFGCTDRSTVIEVHCCMVSDVVCLLNFRIHAHEWSVVGCWDH